MLWSPEKLSALWMKSMITLQRSLPVTNCWKIFKNEKERRPPALMKHGQWPAQGNANVSRGRPLAVLISMKVTTMLRHYDQEEEERQTDGSRDWDSITSVLMSQFAQQGARDFDDEKWLQMIFEGSSKKRIEYCKNRDGTRYCLRAIQGHSGGIPINPELMNYVSVRYKWKEYVFHRGVSWNFQSVLGKGLIPGGKEKDKARQTVFPTPTNPCGKDPEEETPHDDYTVRQKAPCVTTWKHNQDAVHWCTIAKSPGSRNIILANKIICNHGIHNNTRRMHWSCGF